MEKITMASACAGPQAGSRAGVGIGELSSRSFLGMRVDATSYEDASNRVISWASRGESRSVAIATVNNVMQAHDDPEFVKR